MRCKKLNWYCQMRRMNKKRHPKIFCNDFHLEEEKKDLEFHLYRK
jgi:hypothetical protein